MASLRRLPNSKYWIACFTLPSGGRTQRSTKETDRKKALKIAEGYEKASRSAKTEQQARNIISDIYQIISGEKLSSSSIQDFFAQWASLKSKETAPTTAAKYQRLAKQFTDFLGEKAQLDLNHLESKLISGFRDNLAKDLSISSANLGTKIIRVALNQAKRDGLIDFNPAERVPLLKRKKDGIERRPFTVDEIKCVLKLASEEWKGMILFGLYTGQRLSDIASLTWQNIDREQEEFRLTTLKTGRRQVLPLAKPLLDYIDSLTITDDPKQPIFPKAYKTVIEQGRTASLSNQFYEILVEANLVKARTHQGTGKGRSSRRQLNELGFHALRHTATSLLKNAGVSDAVAMEFVGHDSKDISKNYTHIETKALKKAVELMPEFKVE